MEDIPEEKTDVDPDLQPNEAQVIQTTTTEQDKKCDDILRLVHAIDSKIDNFLAEKSKQPAQKSTSINSSERKIDKKEIYL